jgi:GDP-D-mannose dehydratase
MLRQTQQTDEATAFRPKSPYWVAKAAAITLSHSLQEFVTASFKEVGLDWRAHVDGDRSRASRRFGWRPEVDLAEIVARMVQAKRKWKETET